MLVKKASNKIQIGASSGLFYWRSSPKSSCQHGNFWCSQWRTFHQYNISVMASQITIISNVCWTVGHVITKQKNMKAPYYWSFVGGIHLWPTNIPLTNDQWCAHFTLGDWKDISIVHVIIIIKSEVSTLPILSHCSVVVCLRRLLNHIQSPIAHTLRKTGNLFS